MNKRKPWQSVALYLFVFVLCIVILYPYFVMFITAAKTNDEMYARDHILPYVWQWSNFTDIWSAAPVFKYFLNSMIVAGGATAIEIICGIPAAYALARMRFKGKSFFMGAVIISQMFSPIALLRYAYPLMVAIPLAVGLFAEKGDKEQTLTEFENK